jgi:hypothetical protein
MPKGSAMFFCASVVELAYVVALNEAVADVVICVARKSCPFSAARAAEAEDSRRRPGQRAPT